MIETILPAVILAALALLITRLLFSKRKPRGKSTPAYRGSPHRSDSTPRRREGRFRAVSCTGDCAAVREIRGQRFLEREAPSLPLPGCMKSRCHCIYIHHDDRRSGHRDRRGLSRSSNLPLPEDRRAGPRGRRATDLAMA